MNLVNSKASGLKTGTTALGGHKIRNQSKGA